jgi:hypothetical protein
LRQPAPLDQRAVIETPTERVLRIVRERCPDLDLSLIRKPAKPTAKRRGLAASAAEVCTGADLEGKARKPQFAALIRVRTAVLDLGGR